MGFSPSKYCVQPIAPPVWRGAPCLGDSEYINVLPVDDIHPLLAGKQVTSTVHERFGIWKHARLHKLAVLRLNPYDPLICRCKSSPSPTYESPPLRLPALREYTADRRYGRVPHRTCYTAASAACRGGTAGKARAHLKSVKIFDITTY